MNEPKGWVHWHPDGYVLDVDDDKALGMKDAGVFHDIGAAERWVNVCSEYKKTLVGACEVITYEEAERRLAQAAMKATAEELRKEREAAPKPIANLNMAPKTMAEELRAGRAAMPKVTEAEAYAQQERSLRGETKKPTEDRLMVLFRVDIRKVRTSLWRAPTSVDWVATVRTTQLTIHSATSESPRAAMKRALYKAGVDWGALTLQPHPWKRADGTHIRASWEE